MSQIAAVFKPGYKALIAYLTVGYPDLDTTRKAAITLAGNGADIIELGIPFSDPLADGTTIQRASHQALQNGVTPQQCFEMAQQLRGEITTPLVFMTYYNPVYNFGLDAFCHRCVEAGVSGLFLQTRLKITMAQGPHDPGAKRLHPQSPLPTSMEVPIMIESSEAEPITLWGRRPRFRLTRALPTVNPQCDRAECPL